MMTIISVIIGYLLGSIPFALVIGKVFYHTDVRQFGSGNLGGTNTGRVLGKKAGMAVIVCDVLKVVVACGIASFFGEVACIWTGFACCIGHCYPVFAHFKGGKAVSTVFGFLLATSIFLFHNILYFILPFLMFFITLYLFKFVSLASMCGILFSSLYITGTWFSFTLANILVVVASWLMTILVIYRHWANVDRIRTGTESKISWM